MVVGTILDAALIFPWLQAQDSARFIGIGLQIGLFDRPTRPGHVVAFAKIDLVERMAHSGPMIAGTAQESEATDIEPEILSSNYVSIIDLL